MTGSIDVQPEVRAGDHDREVRRRRDGRSLVLLADLADPRRDDRRAEPRDPGPGRYRFEPLMLDIGAPIQRSTAATASVASPAHAT